MGGVETVDSRGPICVTKGWGAQSGMEANCRGMPTPPSTWCRVGYLIRPRKSVPWEAECFTQAYFMRPTSGDLGLPSNEEKEVSRVWAGSCFRNAKAQLLEGNAFEQSLSWFPVLSKNRAFSETLYNVKTESSEALVPGPWRGFLPGGVMQI